MNVIPQNNSLIFNLNIRRDLFICLFLIFANMAVYGQVRNYDFINFDDDDYVYNNQHIQAGFTSESILWAITASHAGNWHPVTWLSHIADIELYGMNPGQHHLTNLLFHIADTLLLFYIFRRMTGAVWKSGLIAALFAVHPLHVESVAWISERKDVLSTFFWLLTMLCYIRYTEQKRVSSCYLLMLLFFMMGLMAKPMPVTLPFVLLLLDYFPLNRFSDKKFSVLFTEKIPLFILSALSCIITYLVQQSGDAVRSLDFFPISYRIANAAVSYAGYIEKMFVPQKLAIFYPSYIGMLSWWRIGGAALLLVPVSFLAVKMAKQYKWLMLGWFWYMGTLVPVIGLVQVGSQAMADRYTYIPLTGLFIMIAWGIPEFASAWQRKINVSGWLSVIAGLFILFFMMMSWIQVSYWQNSITLFEHTAAVTEHNLLAHTNLGLALTEKGLSDKGLFHFAEALRLNPDNPIVLNGIGVALFKQGNIRAALDFFQKGLEKNPDDAQLRYNFEKVLEIQKRKKE